MTFVRTLIFATLSASFCHIHIASAQDEDALGRTSDARGGLSSIDTTEGNIYQGSSGMVGHHASESLVTGPRGDFRLRTDPSGRLSDGSGRVLAHTQNGHFISANGAIMGRQNEDGSVYNARGRFLGSAPRGDIAAAYRLPDHQVME